MDLSSQRRIGRNVVEIQPLKAMPEFVRKSASLKNRTGNDFRQ
jgi:hypothetical protein